MNEKVFVTQDYDNDEDDVRIPTLHGRCPCSVLQDYPEHEQGHRGTGGHLQRSLSSGLQFKNARPSILGSHTLRSKFALKRRARASKS